MNDEKEKGCSWRETPTALDTPSITAPVIVHSKEMLNENTISGDGSVIPRLIPPVNRHSHPMIPAQPTELVPAPEHTTRRDSNAIGTHSSSSTHSSISTYDAIVQRRLRPSSTWTAHQIFYIFILDGLGGMTLSAGVNFALAYVMYTTNPQPVYLWRLPNTLAGDLAITIIVQCVLTWFVELGLVRFDLGNKSVQPLGFIPQPHHPFLRSFAFLPPAAPTTSASQEAAAAEATRRTRLGPRTLTLRSIPSEALRGLFLALLCLLTLWPLGVGLVTLFGQRLEGSRVEFVYGDKFAPQAFKAVMGGLVGLCTTPVMAAFWLVRAGWEADGLHDDVDEGNA